jgi:hypothetical protein
MGLEVVAKLVLRKHHRVEQLLDLRVTRLVSDNTSLM